MLNGFGVVRKFICGVHDWVSGTGLEYRYRYIKWDLIELQP